MIHAIILAGGSGTRFWPFSRELEPKQFIQLIGGVSLLEASIKRLEGVVPQGNIYVVTNYAYFYEVKKRIRTFNIPDKNIILEPEGKNTAPAIGVCAQLIGRLDPDALLIVLPSDHYIKNIAAFRSCLKKAMVCAEHNYLVTIGIKPKSPATGYGYIRTSRRLSVDKQSCFKVDTFLEKPDLIKARKFFRNKKYFWNSGIIVCKAKTFMDELKIYLPELYSLLGSIKTARIMDKVWHRIRPVSVDYGILEHSRRIVLIPASFYWSDLGSWDALNEVLPKDKKGNVIQGDCLDLDSRHLSVFSRSSRLISTIGLKDLIIADTPDALLVCNRQRAQEVKKIVQSLKISKRKECLVNSTEKRPWGAYTVLQLGEGFKVKLVEIEPHKRISLQLHRKRAEHWVVIAGYAKVTWGRKIKIVRTNESIYIPKGTRHRLENPGNVSLKIVEVQTGRYLEEDDIERFDDDFMR